jgi:cytoskeletal protein RodZ
LNQHHPQQPEQPYNQPYQPQQSQGWGVPPQAPQPPKKSTGKKVGLGCLGAVGIIVIIAIGSAVGGNSGSDTGSSKDGSVTAASTPTSGSKAEQPAAAEDTPVKVTAKTTAFTKSILADGSSYTSVLVTVKNDSGEAVDVNPLYFSITDTHGTKHAAELAVDEGQIDTVNLAPGENISGTITGKGRFTAKYVTFTDGLLGDPMRVNVS